MRWWVSRNLIVLLAAWIVPLAGGVALAEPVRLERVTPQDLPLAGRLFMAEDAAFPKDAAAVDAWRAGLRAVDRVNLLGGAYWFVADLANTTPDHVWVLEAYGTLIDRVDIAVYGSDGTVQRFESGYQRPLPYALHYGQDARFLLGVTYRVVVRLSSPYYASQPGFRVYPRMAYQQHVTRENFGIMAALGAIACLAIYNLFVFLSARDGSLLLYALYLGVSFVGWAWTFHLPPALFGWHELRWHYVWFFLIPITSTLFYLRFLRVAEWSLPLTRLSWGVIALSAALLPSSFLALPYAHSLATLCIGVQMLLALTCGVISWRRGQPAARFFVWAFLALLIPGLFILPANVGLIPDLLENAELLTLWGTVLDGLLLAFALAERIRLLQTERDASLAQMSHALRLANTDSLTGIGNRHAFDAALAAAFAQGREHVLMLIDLDGLKRVNDQRGHAQGDELLRRFAAGLAGIALPAVSSYRLGGDEFIVLSPREHEAAIREAILGLESSLREDGFPEFGASVGVAYTGEHGTPSDAFGVADARMYQEKAQRKLGRVTLGGV